MKVNKRYLPKALTKKDRQKQFKSLTKSRRLYTKGNYFTRPKIASFKSKPSKFVTTAKRIYGVEKIGATKELASASGCSVSSLKRIIRKGEGAYYSSGSRPNQTAQSWGIARLASALASGKAGAVDYTILAKGCKRGSKGYIMAEKARKKFGTGSRKAPKTTV